jgi:hypothetical protein
MGLRNTAGIHYEARGSKLIASIALADQNTGCPSNLFSIHFETNMWFDGLVTHYCVFHPFGTRVSMDLQLKCGCVNCEHFPRFRFRPEPLLRSPQGIYFETRASMT